MVMKEIRSEMRNCSVAQGLAFVRSSLCVWKGLCDTRGKTSHPQMSLNPPDVVMCPPVPHILQSLWGIARTLAVTAQP